MRTLVFIILLSASFYSSAQESVHIEVTCGEEKAVLDGLKEKFGEEFVVSGESTRTYAGEKMKMSIFSNNKTGSYTILIHTANGVVCAIDDGVLNLRNKQNTPRSGKEVYL